MFTMKISVKHVLDLLICDTRAIICLQACYNSAYREKLIVLDYISAIYIVC